MTQPHVPQALNAPHAVLTAGDKPGSERRLFQGGVLEGKPALFLSGAALAVAMAVPGVAEAQYFGGYGQTKNTSAREYSRDQGLRATDGRLAEVVMVRRVDIENQNSYSMGGVVGAALGAVAADRIDNSDARNIGRVLLGGLGAVAGHKVQQRVTRREGVQITLLERTGYGEPRLINIVQDNDLPIHPGDTVMIEGSGNDTRVIPLDPAFQQRLRGGRPLSQAPEMSGMEQLRQARALAAAEAAPAAPAVSKRRGPTA